MGSSHRKARAVFTQNNTTPYTCGGTAGIGCKESMPELGDVHHLDHNMRNNAPDNLVTMHERCHHQYHMSVREPLSEAARLKMIATLKVINRRKPTHTAESRAKIRDAVLARWANMPQDARRIKSPQTACDSCDKVFKGPTGVKMHKIRSGCGTK